MDTRDNEYTTPPWVSASERLFRKRPVRRAAAIALIAAGVYGGIKVNGEDTDAVPASQTVKQETIKVGSLHDERGLDRIRSLVDALPLVNIDNTTSISAIAQRMSDERGYQILPEYLAAANKTTPAFSKRDEKGGLVDKITIDKDKLPELKSNVVSPIYYGFDSVDEEGESITTFAYDWGVSVDFLRRLNPQLAAKKPDQALPIGTVLKVDTKVDTHFVKREMTVAEGSYYGMGSSALVKKIDDINSPASGIGKAPDQPGDVGFFPLPAGKTFTPEEVVAAFPTTTILNVEATQIKEKQVKPEDKNKDKGKGKGNVVPKKPSPIERVKTKPDTITPRQRSLQEATGIPASLKAEMTKYYRSAKYIPAGVLAAEMRADVGFNSKTAGKLAEQVAEMDQLYSWVNHQINTHHLKGDPLELTLQTHKYGKNAILRLGRTAAMKDVRTGRVPAEVVAYPRRIFNWADGYGYNRFKNFGSAKLQLDTKTDIKKGWRPKVYNHEDREGFTPNLRRLFDATKSKWGIKSFGGVGGPKSGHISGSDHYTGHAADIMLDPLKHNDNTYRQEEITNWLLANATKYNIKYVIVNDQIWSYNRMNEGWRNYNLGRDAPKNMYEYTKAHDDHIHVSVY